METDDLREALVRALGDKYEIVRLLGRGGMGAVFLGRDRALERAVAIKVLPPGTAAAPEAVERFRREARTAARLQHPGIVPLYHFGEHEGLLYFVMGYVHGESLGTRLQRDGAFAPDRARALLAQVADALDHAHRQGVVHRDLKPDNILLDDETGRTHLTDFGIAKSDVAGQQLTQVGIAVGTPAYMSPEQAAGERDVDGRSDLYSLGVVGFQMLAGRLPFAGPSVRDFLVQHTTVAPPPLASVAPRVPDELAAAVERCLQKEPARRWRDAREFRDALGAGADDPTALAYELTEITSVSAWLLVALLLAAVVVPLSLLTGKRVLGLQWQGMLVLPLSLALGVVPAVRGARRRGFSWRIVLRALLLEPSWWPLWWPRSFQRPGTVRERLPADVRRYRQAFGLVWAMLVLEIVLLVVLPGAERAGSVVGVPATHDGFALFWAARVGSLVTLYALLAFLAAFLLLYAGLHGYGWVLGRRYGLRTQEVMRMASKPWASAFWQDARIEAVLAQGDDARLGRAPTTPEETVAAIGLVERRLPPAQAGAAATARVAAQRLADAIALADRQLPRLEQGATLLAGQPELVAGVEARLAGLGRDRERWREQLGALWAEVAALRADGAVDTSSGRVRAVAQEVLVELDTQGVRAEAAAPLGKA